MKRTVLLFILGLLVLSGFFGVKLITSIKPRFSFSFPLRAGGQEIHANLPAGRYALTVTTNFSRTALGVIPPQCNYNSRLAIQVRSKQTILVQETNFHYLVFSLSGESSGSVEFSIQTEMEDEALVLNLGRGF